MYSVSQVLSSQFARTWSEAVAIVQEAAYQLQPGLALPSPEDMVIDEAGTLTFGFGSESSEDPVSALAGLLDSLLKGVDAPQALRDLANQNMGRKPTHTSIASFSQALAFFERPNRASDIGAVARRLGGSNEQSAAEQEFQRLREKVAQTPDSAKKDEKDKKPRKKQPRLTKLQQLAVVSTVFALVFGTLAYRSGLHRNVGALTSGVESGIQGVVSAGLEWAGLSKTASAAPSDELVEAEDDSTNGGRVARAANKPARRPEPTRPSDRVERTTGSSPHARSQSAAVPDDSLRSAPLVGMPPVPEVRSSRAPAAPAAPTATVTAVPASTAIFTERNAEVEPPVLVRPQLPREPAPGDDTGIFEMLVDENGDVSEIKLISPRRRFHDRMLVAAAKAWKFRAATLHGYPVKYRVRIPIILKGMP